MVEIVSCFLQNQLIVKNIAKFWKTYEWTQLKKKQFIPSVLIVNSG